MAETAQWLSVSERTARLLLTERRHGAEESLTLTSTQTEWAEEVELHPWTRLAWELREKSGVVREMAEPELAKVLVLLKRTATPSDRDRD
jgi:hypothetical protein